MSKILIIDDDPLLRSTLGDILRIDGHRVYLAENGDVGLRVLESHEVDLMITDIFMPEREGIETIVEVRRARPNLKILAISGGGQVRDMDFLPMARKLGAHGVLSKPFEPDDVLRAIETLTRPGS